MKKATGAVGGAEGSAEQPKSPYDRANVFLRGSPHHLQSNFPRLLPPSRVLRQKAMQRLCCAGTSAPTIALAPLQAMLVAMLVAAAAAAA
jgi:hypothetical protein